MWKRAIVKEIIPNSGAHCWALDYGEESVAKQVFEMPDCLKNVEPMSKCCSLSDVVWVSVFKKKFRKTSNTYIITECLNNL